MSSLDNYNIIRWKPKTTCWNQTAVGMWDGPPNSTNQLITFDRCKEKCAEVGNTLCAAFIFENTRNPGGCSRYTKNMIDNCTFHPIDWYDMYKMDEKPTNKPVVQPESSDSDQVESLQKQLSIYKKKMEISEA